MAEQNRDIKTAPDGEFQLVVFGVGSEEFGVEIKKVQEIIRMTSITKVPQAPDYIRGIINLRGRIIVVINLNVVLGMGSKEQDENTRIIVASTGDSVMGTEYVLGVGKLDRRLLILLNLDKILGSKELHSVQGISAQAAEDVIA